MSDEEAGGVQFWFGFWLSWLFSSFWFVVRVMAGNRWDVGVVVGYSFVILVYLGEWLPC